MNCPCRENPVRYATDEKSAGIIRSLIHHGHFHNTGYCKGCHELYEEGRKDAE